jgi:hypothetical protein
MLPTADEWASVRETFKFWHIIGNPRRAAIEWLGVECVARIRHLLTPESLRLAELAEAHAEGRIQLAAVLDAARTFRDDRDTDVGVNFSTTESAVFASAYLMLGDLMHPNDERFLSTNRLFILVEGMAGYCCRAAVLETIPYLSWEEAELPPELEATRAELLALPGEERYQVWSAPEPDPRLQAILRALEPARLQREAQHKPLSEAEQLAQCNLVREIIQPPYVTEFSLEFRTPTVVALAREISEKRAFDQMPILADALQDAGCNDEHILSHCRSGGPHVRGCWVLALVLEK